jgi:hypothetical protein
MQVARLLAYVTGMVNQQAENGLLRAHLPAGLRLAVPCTISVTRQSARRNFRQRQPPGERLRRARGFVPAAGNRHQPSLPFLIRLAPAERHDDPFAIGPHVLDVQRHQLGPAERRLLTLARKGSGR